MVFIVDLHGGGLTRSEVHVTKSNVKLRLKVKYRITDIELKLSIQSTLLNRVTSVRGHFAPIKRRTLLTENILY